MKIHGHAVKAIRAAQGRSQRDVAAGASIACGTLARIELGTKGASDDTIKRIADALRVDPRAISYPEEPPVQVTPEVVQKIADLLSMPAEVASQ
jgi:transcriptional regulator with XRE-family HTH domain